jgi:DNA-binding NtrC family response regulator
MTVRAVSQNSPAKPSRSVLVVDDDPLQRLQLTETLSDLGIEVLQEGEGSAALETMRAARPAVVIMDVRMPVLDGIAAAQAMADLDYKPRVILMTGDPSSLYRANTTQLDIFAVLEKPVPMRTLSRFILKALG